ncbi:hypothetical protein ABD76_10300 [Paenibacillus dendritiformis]|uniref:hypothetical protein n=1 Tax=Paenibacillus dendritiformis TaxID=130049 RepID=UPI0018CF57FA|nr:hypothetical protein [Paenibacillus dendritiformis]MBG9792855.1 hypothetical protein [Paenibacillus dendritiformis]
MLPANCLTRHPGRRPACRLSRGRGLTPVPAGTHLVLETADRPRTIGMIHRYKNEVQQELKPLAMK